MSEQSRHLPQSRDYDGECERLEFPTPAVASNGGRTAELKVSAELPKPTPSSPTFQRATAWVSDNPVPAVCYCLGTAGLFAVASPVLAFTPTMGAVGVTMHGAVVSSAAGVLYTLSGVAQAVGAGAPIYRLWGRHCLEAIFRGKETKEKVAGRERKSRG
nr:uncharacterized protein CTRU02_11195 [Colletotrichum truncatum]KAF6786324.1 hypothetical protein CTRU02_11195 [Colletotrichum truncatum]